jgi:hypothetical protein
VRTTGVSVRTSQRIYELSREVIAFQRVTQPLRADALGTACSRRLWHALDHSDRSVGELERPSLGDVAPGLHVAATARVATPLTADPPGERLCVEGASGLHVHPWNSQRRAGPNAETSSPRDSRTRLDATHRLPYV